jgi:DNA-directed RNA polymerase subunit M/transcription elongation factor TFIIS
VTVVICPSCGSDLIEPEKTILYCIKCSDEFRIEDANYKEVDMNELLARCQELEKYIQKIRR